MSDPKEPKEQLRIVEEVFLQGLQFLASATPPKEYGRIATEAEDAWAALKKRLGAIYLITTFRHLEGHEDIRHIEVQIEVERGVFVSVIDEVQENYISHIVEPSGIQQAIEDSSR